MIQLRVSGFASEKIVSLAALLSEHTSDSGVISAQVVDESRVRELNERYAQESGSTDVLSFSYTEDGQVSVDKDNERELGDILISKQHIQRQAHAAGTDTETEFLLLLAHGALHILGYDHAQVAEREAMDALQSELMEALGLSYRNFGWSV